MRCGGGLKLAHAVRGGRFSELLDDIESLVGSVRPASLPGLAGPTLERMKRLCHQTWTEAKPVTIGDEVDRYLRGRGINQGAYPRTLRFHPALGYYEATRAEALEADRQLRRDGRLCAGAGRPRRHPAPDVPQGGRKALGDQSKKLLSAGINGAAVRLDEATDELALTEGIETALAVRLRTGKPTWAAINCGNLEGSGSPSRCGGCASTRTTTRTPSSLARPRPTSSPSASCAKRRRPASIARSKSSCPAKRARTGADIWLASLARTSARRRLSGVAAMPPLSVCPVRAQRQRFPKWQLPGHAELQRR